MTSVLGSAFPFKLTIPLASLGDVIMSPPPGLGLLKQSKIQTFIQPIWYHLVLPARRDTSVTMMKQDNSCPC